MHPHARRRRRRGGEGRAARRRRGPPAAAAARRRQHLLRVDELRQEEHRPRPADRGRQAPRHRAGGAGRRRGRELPPGRDEAARPRLRDPVARQPAPDLRLDLRLRPDRADGLGAGLRAGDPCRVGLRARLQPVPARRRPAGEQRHLHRRRDGRLLRLRRDPARPLRAREERPRPAHRRLADGLGARHADLRDAGGAVPARAAAPGLRAGARQRRLRDGRGGDAEEPRGAVRDHRLSRRQDRPALRHHGDQGGELAGAAGADRALDLAAHRRRVRAGLHEGRRAVLALSQRRRGDGRPAVRRAGPLRRASARATRATRWRTCPT